MFSKPGRAKIGTNASEIVNWAKIRHKAVMLSALQLLYGIDTQGSQEFIQPFLLKYIILNRTIACG